MNDTIFEKTSEKFKVAGAGEIEISNDCCHFTGSADGFHFGASWGKYGLKAGGVLDKKEAEKLATHILNVLKEQK